MPRRAKWQEKLADKLRPTVMSAAESYAGHRVQRALGFWVCFHYWGGFDSMVQSGLWSRAGVYNQRNDFLELFGVDVADAWPGAVPGLAHMDGYQGPSTKKRASDV